MAYKAEYIWIDGIQPIAKLRSKTKILDDGADLPIWGFDGSSTDQAPGDKSDCVLQPVFSCPDPIRGGDNVLVLSEVLYTDMTPHASNTRAACNEVANKFKDQEPTNAMREGYDAVITAAEALGPKAAEHVAGYGADIEHRLTGLHETAPWNEFNYGVSDRGASVRIPWQVEVDKKGYIEDRRPNANCDPYVVTRLIVDTCCSALAG